MHLYIVTRGIKSEVDKFITELQGKYFPFKFQDEGDKEPKDCFVQMSVRPIQLYELVFPETSRDIVLNTVLGGKVENQTQHKKHNKIIWAIRKALGVSKIKDYKKDLKFPITLEHVEVVGIGEKKDYFNKHEGL